MKNMGINLLMQVLFFLLIEMYIIFVKRIMRKVMKRFFPLIILFSITTLAQEETSVSTFKLLNIILALSIPITTLIATLIAQHYSNKRHAIQQELQLFQNWKEKYINALSSFQASIPNIFQIEDTYKREMDEINGLIKLFEDDTETKTSFEMIDQQYSKIRNKADRLLKTYFDHAVYKKMLLNYIPIEYREQFSEKENKLITKIKEMVKSENPAEHSEELGVLEDDVDNLLSSILDQKERKVRESYEKYI